MSQHEEEELEQLKRFWQDYGTPILIGVALALAVFMGWRFWQNSRLEDATKAATVFQDMLAAAQRSQLNPADKASSTDVQRFAKNLREDYASTPYALTAGLLLARQANDRGDLKEAEKQLNWVLDQKPGEGVRIIAVTRLARVLAAGKQYDAALALLGKESSAAFVPTVEELKGDIYQAQGRTADARKAYLAASAALRARGEQSPILDLKMADVGVAAPAATPPAKAADEESTPS